MVMRVLEEAAFSMRQIAESAGLNYTTIRRWRIGERVPGRQNQLRLAAALREKSRQLEALAAELESEAD